MPEFMAGANCIADVDPKGTYNIGDVGAIMHARRHASQLWTTRTRRAPSRRTDKTAAALQSKCGGFKPR